MDSATSGRRVLLTGAGGAAAVSFIRALAGEPCVIHAGDMDPNAAGLYLVPANRRRFGQKSTRWSKWSIAPTCSPRTRFDAQEAWRWRTTLPIVDEFGFDQQAKAQ
jgi:hypothetical protein